MRKNIIAWQPCWYELDQSIVVGDKGWFYLSLDKSSFSNDMASENDIEVVAEIKKISHKTLGIVKGILTDGLEIVPAVHHIPSPGASTAREKGSAGPAQERRDSETLHERNAGIAPSVAR
jgi:hypothetical protein